MSTAKTPPKKTAPKKGPFKQALQKPQPWRFGGQALRADRGAGIKAQPDAERLAGKSRKVH
ncbi:hypothetical protein SAMN04488120_101199 [Fontimonas thermophila]|uniref:Uncharacterized protein n=1 Tax=Fontimonas thermophila TaxID=1076937 RepID=A0A1I2H799_9GAMM|nr:hypothetical protein [Fontimonas thermophila]SFF25438.1 hypothetical protein SAMN04488120_101199 [Fontimonas thermophila]